MGALHVGIADHLGWAVVVTADDGGVVHDRRRILLVEPGVPPMPIHHDSKHLDLAGTAALLARVRASVRRATSEALDTLARELDGAVGSVSLRAVPPDFPTALEVLVRVPWEARADPVMYRQILASDVTERGWDVHAYDAKRAPGQLASRWPDRAQAVLDAPRATWGPPWGQDHRVALAALLTRARGPAGPG